MALDIIDCPDEGYVPVISYDGWRVAIINSCEMTLKENRHTIEKHMETDEVFILLSGNASLYIGDDRTEYKMEQNKIYNVKCGTWHGISMSPDSKIVVFENDNTDDSNTIRKNIDNL